MNKNIEHAYKHWRVETDAERIAWLCIDKADGSANVLSGPVLRELADIIEPFRTSPPSGIVIHSGKDNGFVMGADINEFTTIRTAEEAYNLIRLGQQVMDAPRLQPGWKNRIPSAVDLCQVGMLNKPFPARRLPAAVLSENGGAI